LSLRINTTAYLRTGSTGFTDTKPGRVVLHLLRLITSFVFIFSGFVKAVDPLGTVYKIEDYLMAFGPAWHSLSVVAFPAALLLIALELMIGIQLLFVVRFRINTLLAMLFMLVMTPLTLYIAIYNPVTDCGCFGDALKVSNWTTFGKNIVLLTITITLVATRSKVKTFFVRPVENAIALVFLLLSGGFMAYNLMHLPIIDFRPYAIGTNIPEAMKIPDGAPVDVYRYSFTYQKNGETKSFSIDELPDSTWRFIEQKSELLKKGYEPPIHSFTILNADYQDIGPDLLEYKGRTYLLVMYDLSKASVKGVEKLNAFYASHSAGKIRFMGVTASPSEEIEKFKKSHWLTFPVYTADPVFLKTMIRANPGLIVLENGTIIDKRNWRDIDQIQ
jgi:hypothetical protein